MPAPSKTHFQERQEELDKKKKEEESNDNSEAKLGAKKIADTSPFATDAPTTPALANASAENLSNQMGQANGIGRVSEKTYQTSSGPLTGGEFTNKNGTYLVVNDANTGAPTKYKVETNQETGVKTLVDSAPGQRAHESLTVQSVADAPAQPSRTGNGDPLASRQPIDMTPPPATPPAEITAHPVSAGAAPPQEVTVQKKDPLPPAPPQDTHQPVLVPVGSVNLGAGAAGAQGDSGVGGGLTHPAQPVDTTHPAQPVDTLHPTPIQTITSTTTDAGAGAVGTKLPGDGRPAPPPQTVIATPGDGSGGPLGRQGSGQQGAGSGGDAGAGQIPVVIAKGPVNLTPAPPSDALPVKPAPIPTPAPPGGAGGDTVIAKPAPIPTPAPPGGAGGDTIIAKPAPIPTPAPPGGAGGDTVIAKPAPIPTPAPPGGAGGDTIIAKPAPIPTPAPPGGAGGDTVIAKPAPIPTPAPPGGAGGDTIIAKPAPIPTPAPPGGAGGDTIIAKPAPIPTPAPLQPVGDTGSPKGANPVPPPLQTVGDTGIPKGANPVPPPLQTVGDTGIPKGANPVPPPLQTVGDTGIPKGANPVPPPLQTVGDTGIPKGANPVPPPLQTVGDTGIAKGANPNPVPNPLQPGGDNSILPKPVNPVNLNPPNLGDTTAGLPPKNPITPVNLGDGSGIHAPTVPVDGTKPIITPPDSIAGKPPTLPGSDLGVAKLPTSDAPITIAKLGADAGIIAGVDKLRAQLPTDTGINAATFAPNPAQTLALKQAGFDVNNAQDVAFLAAARAQLMATRMGDGTNQNMTLANVLGGANAVEANKLAAFLTGKPDATAGQVLLNEANLAKLNALFKTEAVAGISGLPAANMDVKNMVGKAMSDFMAPHAVVPTQKDILGELHRLTSLTNPLEVGQKLAMADIISRTIAKPIDTTATTHEIAVVANPATTLVAKPDNAALMATALADARTRAAEMAELSIKPTITTAARPEVTNESLGLAVGKPATIAQMPEGKAIDVKLPDAKTIASGTEAIAGIRIAEDALHPTGKSIIVDGKETKDGKGGTELTSRSDMAELGENHAGKKRPDEKEVAHQGGGMSIDGSMMTGAALKILDTKGEDKDNTANKKDDEKKAQRRRYIVKPNDTLESVARRTLRDPRLAALILSINTEILPADLDHEAPLTAGTAIWIPSDSEVQSYFGGLGKGKAATKDEKLSPEEELARRFGSGWDGAQSAGPDTEPVGGLLGAALIATAKRRENVEKFLGPLSTAKTGDTIKYTVRLGDSLKSIAMKHPALHDVALWELVASVNDISLPAKDPSSVRLTRGATLRLPTPDEIKAFREKQEKKNAPQSNSGTRSIPPRATGTIGVPAITSGVPTGNTDEDSVTRVSAPILDAGASLLRAGGFVKDRKTTAEDAATVVTSPIDMVPKAPTKAPPSDKPSIENVKVLAADCRIVRRHQVDTNGRLYQAQLEVLWNGEWSSVMMYNISDGNCWRKSLNEAGVTEILQLELPTPAIHQMLESDFSNNWEEYRERFLRLR